MSEYSEYRKLVSEAQRDLGARLETGNGPHRALVMPDGVRILVKQGTKLSAHSVRNLRADLRRWSEGKPVGMGRERQ